MTMRLCRVLRPHHPLPARSPAFAPENRGLRRCASKRGSRGPPLGRAMLKGCAPVSFLNLFIIVYVEVLCDKTAFLRISEELLTHPASLSRRAGRDHRGRRFLPHATNEETEAPRGRGTWRASPTATMAELTSQASRRFLSVATTLPWAPASI